VTPPAPTDKQSSTKGAAGVARVGLLWRGERRAGAAPTRGDTLLPPLFDRLAQLDVDAQPLVYSDDAIEEVREELLQLDGVLVWVNPIQDGRDRTNLDALLREAAAQGIWVSAHPDTILRMGTKEVLVRTKNLGWGTDTHLYETAADLRDQFPARLAADHVRVLKQHRGNGGQGVWKVELVKRAARSNARTETPAQHSRVRVQRADQRDGLVDEMSLGGFIDSCAPYFSNSGRIIDQAFQGRLSEGMIRCYLVQDEVVGFCHQWPKGLLPATPETDAAATRERVMEPPSTPAYQALKTKIEAEWVPQMKGLLDLDAASMPAIWDADFLYGPKTTAGEDTYILCEINVSAVWPYPEMANPKLAEAAVAATIASKAARSET
jgi:hypothetical protein